MTFEFLQKSILVLLGVGFIYQCQASIPDQTNGTNDTVSSVTFASHCRGPKGRSRLGLSMRGEYLGYEFNRTNYFDKGGSVVGGGTKKYDVVIKRLMTKHLLYFDTLELWHSRPEHRLFQIVLKGKIPEGLSIPERRNLYRVITNELDYSFDVRLANISFPMQSNILYNAEGSVPGFKFAVTISRDCCRMSIVSLRVLEPQKTMPEHTLKNEVNVDTNGL